MLWEQIHKRKAIGISFLWDLHPQGSLADIEVWIMQWWFHREHWSWLHSNALLVGELVLHEVFACCVMEKLKTWMENKKVGISWQQISFLYAAFNLQMEVIFPCWREEWRSAEWEGGISWSKFLLYCGIPSCRGFPPPLLFEGEMKKSQVENKTMGFHGEKVFFYMAFQIAE
jgi:hypothetical protein